MCNYADVLFQKNIRKVLEEGVLDVNPRPRWHDGTPAHTRFITHVVNTYTLSDGYFPITTVKPSAIKSSIKELRWMFQDGSNSLDILENKYGIKWWRDWDIGNRTIGLRYGGTIGKYDLTRKLLNDIKTDPYGRRHIISLWQENDFETPGLQPCLITYLFSVRGEFLDLMVLQRSSDLIAAGNVDCIQCSALLMMVARHTGYKTGKFTWVVNNMHIYDRHVSVAKELLNRKPSEYMPRLELKEGITDFFDITEDDFIIHDYHPQEKIKIELAV